VSGPSGGRYSRATGAIVGAVATLGVSIILNYVMSKLEKAIDRKVAEHLTDEKMTTLRPRIASLMNQRLAEFSEAELRNPSKPLFANVELLSTVHRSGDEEQVMLDLEIELVSVTISTEKVDTRSHSRIWVRAGGTVVPAPAPDDFNILPRAPRDLVRTTVSEPLSDALRAEFERQDREKRQKAIVAELAKEAKKNAPAAPPPTSPKGPPKAGPDAFLPEPEAPAPSFLPNAPTRGNQGIAADTLKVLEADGRRLVARGSNITQEEVPSFLRAERQWRLMVNYGLNWCHEHAPGRPAESFNDLLQDPARPGKQLEELRARYGGS